MHPLVNAPSEKRHGVIVSWDESRGFGFARTPDHGDVFVHARYLKNRKQALKPGDLVRFVLTEGRNGRLAAADVDVLTPKPSAQTMKPQPAPIRISDVSRLVAACALLAGAIAASIIGRAPWWLASAYGLMSLASMTAYWLDKSYAIQGRYRVSETALHVCDALCGIPGGLFAQHVFRHKTRKAAFRAITRMIFLFHCVFLMAVLSGAVFHP